MASVGIDVSKGKSTACVLKPYGEIVCRPFEIQHLRGKDRQTWLKNEANGKDKLSDFVERFWHFDLITSISLEKFTDEYLVWAKEKKNGRSW